MNKKRNKSVLMALMLAFGVLFSSTSVKAETLETKEAPQEAQSVVVSEEKQYYPNIEDYESPLMLIKMSFDEESEGDIVLLYGGYFSISEFWRSPEYKNDLDPMWMYYTTQVKLGNIKP